MLLGVLILPEIFLKILNKPTVASNVNTKEEIIGTTMQHNITARGEVPPLDEAVCTNCELSVIVCLYLLSFPRTKFLYIG